MSCVSVAASTTAGVVVHELSKEAEGFGFVRGAPDRSRSICTSKALRLVVQGPDRSIQFRFEQLGACDRSRARHGAPREALSQRRPKPRAASHDVRRLVEQHQVERQVVEIVRGVRSGTPLAAGWLRAQSADAQGAATNGRDRALDQVLVDAAVLVQQTERRLEPVRERLALRMREPFVVDAAHAVDDADVTGFRQERRVVDEAPQGQQAVDAAGLADSPGGCGRASPRRHLHVDAFVLAGVVSPPGL